MPVFQHDSLSLLTQLPALSTDLIYIDPPWNTGIERRLQSQKAGFVVSDIAYADAMLLPEYLAWMEKNIREGYRVLKLSGSFFLHCGIHIAPHLRLLMNRVFEGGTFVNEIIWAYDYGGRGRDRWPQKHDVIFWYAKSQQWTFNYDVAERIPYMAPGLVGAEKATRGKLPTDVWWTTIVPTNGAEKTGYPTQKPEKLLQRIIETCTAPGDMVLDFFAGSGTTGAVAARLGRRYILCDTSEAAYKIMCKRLGVRGEKGVSTTRKTKRERVL